ncbi:TraB/GumN family protein [Thiolapillus brandeum]|uniref:TraB family protein n=1 Tax=Thiolapillus brandeum TaxID=1076588 RepID=A0A7U6GKP7_9GAMM|nr:TraB/GumN family protein [Thiolapillus brandeum]BAO45394.1 TraB family protein [Thiolapillus brandeum]
MHETPSQEPIQELSIKDSKITLLGTAHVSRASADKVEQLIETGDYDAVAVELCPSRYNAMLSPDSLAKMNLMEVIRSGKASMVIANLAMGAYQQRIAEQFGIEPGAEQRMAIDKARENHLPVLLIDREIGTTLKRTAANLSWWKRWTLFTGLLVSLISREEVEEEEIEKLKEGDMLETTFAEFAHDREDLYRPLIEERDEYMAARLAQEIEENGHQDILAVVGAGHLKGIRKKLGRNIQDPARTIAELDSLPKPSRWPKLLPWFIVALVFVGFGIGFYRSPELGWQLVWSWVLINGSLSAIGAALAGAHPLTVVTAFVAAPITSLNPTIGAGMVTAAAELWLRKPTVEDFSNLRHDTIHWTGWWKNRVSRTLLVFLFSTLGSAIGTYVAGFRIVGQLSGGG